MPTANTHHLPALILAARSIQENEQYASVAGLAQHLAAEWDADRDNPPAELHEAAERVFAEISAAEDAYMAELEERGL